MTDLTLGDSQDMVGAEPVEINFDSQFDLADLKKTIAVLLEDMMERIDRLEQRLDGQSNASYGGRFQNEAVGHHIAPRSPSEVRYSPDTPSKDRPIDAQGGSSCPRPCCPSSNRMPLVSPLSPLCTHSITW